MKLEAAPGRVVDMSKTFDVAICEIKIDLRRFIRLSLV